MIKAVGDKGGPHHANEIVNYLHKLANGLHLTREESTRTFQIMLMGGATPAQIAAILIGLRLKGETLDELTGAAEVMRTRSGKIQATGNILDTCGTGGDEAGTLNVSTAVAFVVAGCGVKVAKHGNRAISSRSGSADVLSELGVNIDADESLVEASLQEAGMCFMMAPKFHRAMRHIMPIRKELGVRTIFNLLGPLCNPASTQYHLLGVFSEKWVKPMAEVLLRLGAKRAWVVYGRDGLDELTTTTSTVVAEVKENQVHCFEITPEDAGLARSHKTYLMGKDAAYNARALHALLRGETGPYRDIVLLNAAASLIIAEKVSSLKEGVLMAASAIDNGNARKTLAKLVEVTNR